MTSSTPGELSPAIPSVTIGMPVYNGSRYLRTTLDSLLAQDHRDFVVVISDNGSTDDTAAVAAEYVRFDPRFRYIRHEQNRGAAWNYNHVFDLNESPYFKWAACDDLLAPTYLSRCLRALRADPAAVLCHTLTTDIDEAGNTTRRWDQQPNGTQADRVERFTEMLMRRHQCFPVFGLIRADILSRTKLIGAYTESDDVLVAHLALFGRFLEVPEALFFRREHPDRSVVAQERTRDRTAWFDPAREGLIVFPTWRIAGEYVRSVVETPMDASDRARCLGAVGRWSAANGGFLARNVAWAGREIIRRGVHRFDSRRTIERSSTAGSSEDAI